MEEKMKRFWIFGLMLIVSVSFVPLIGCGGVGSGADAYAKIRAGATLVHQDPEFAGLKLPQEVLPLK